MKIFAFGLLLVLALAAAAHEELPPDSNEAEWRVRGEGEVHKFGTETRFNAQGEIEVRDGPGLTREDSQRIASEHHRLMQEATHRKTFQFDKHLEKVRSEHGAHVGKRPANPAAGSPPDGGDENMAAMGLADHLRAVLDHFHRPPADRDSGNTDDVGGGGAATAAVSHPVTVRHLEEIEALVHDIDQAHDLCKLHGDRDIVKLLGLPSSANGLHEIHHASLRVLLAATRNNPGATESFIGSGAMPAVLGLLSRGSDEGDQRTKALCLAAASSLMSHHRMVQNKFVESGGPDAAVRAYAESAPAAGHPLRDAALDVKRRVLVLVLDHLVGADGEDKSALAPHLVSPGWCRRIPVLAVHDDIMMEDSDLAEKLLDTIAAMANRSAKCAREAAEFEHRHGAIAHLVSLWGKSAEGEFERDLAAKGKGLIDTLGGFNAQQQES